MPLSFVVVYLSVIIFLYDEKKIFAEVQTELTCDDCARSRVSCQKLVTGRSEIELLTLITRSQFSLQLSVKVLKLFRNSD